MILLHRWVLIRQYIELMDSVLKDDIGCAADTLRCVKTFPLHSTELTKHLKINLLERAQVWRATKLHTWEERCNARAHKLGNLPPESCRCRKANQKSLREFNSWKTCIPSSTSTATFICGGGNFNGRSREPWLSINPVRPLLIPSITLPDSHGKVFRHVLSRLLRCIAVCECACMQESCYSNWF